MSPAALLLLAPLALAAPAEEPSFALDPPPGWKDVTAAKDEPEVLISLKGPETSSFMLARTGPLGLQDRGVVRTFLLDVLAGLNRRTGLGFTPASNLVETTFDNGLHAYYIKAHYKEKPRLILAVAEFRGVLLMATLISSVPDVLLPSTLGKVEARGRASRPGDGPGRLQSLDAQLAFDLGRGLVPRALTSRERKLGFVAALKGLDSEIMVMKLVEEGTPIKDQPRIVVSTVLSVEGVQKQTLSEISLLETPAGPDLVYAWARLKEPGGPTQFAAGYMPWCYWGYSVLAKGPRAADLMREAFEGLSPGPSALPKLLAETPRVPVPRELRLRKGSRAAWALSAAALIVVGYLLWRRRKGPTKS